MLPNHKSFAAGLLAIVLTTTIAAVCRADEGLDWSVWRAMPVMDAGRRMPLDTFARETVRAVCGRENPRLDFVGQTRKFSAAELLFSWLAEPEKWEKTAFLRAGNKTLREDILDVPSRDALGKRLRYVSPDRLEKSPKFDRYLSSVAIERQRAAAGGKDFSPTGEDEAATELDKAYGVYRTFGFDPRRPAIARTRFFTCLGNVVRTWRSELAPNLRPWVELKQKDELGEIVDRVNGAMKRLVALYHKDRFTLSDAEPSINALCKAADELNTCFRDTRDRAFEAGDADVDADVDAKMLDDARAMLYELATRTKTLVRQSSELRRSLFANGRSLRVVPALDPWGLELERDPRHKNHPWLNLQAVLFASPPTLAGYPTDKVAAVRDSFEEARAVYVDRFAPQRSRRFAQAMRSFADAMRRLGESIEPAREALPVAKKDEALIAATAYPPPDFTANEVWYNRLDPFLWSWAVTLASVACFALGFGVLRRTMFMLGTAVLAVGQGFTLYGLWLRAMITGMIPVTNMFETVLFVGATVALLGLWFSMLPLLWPGLGKAWELTAMPWRKMRVEKAATWSAGRICILAVRALLSGAMVYLLAIGNFNPSGDGAVLGLLPRSASAGLAGLSGTIVLWAISLPVFLWTIWFFPRAVPAALLGIVLVPWTIVKRGFKGPFDESLDRRAIVVSGAVVASIAYLVAYFSPGPVFNRGVGLEMAAILRNNFWLAIHVLIITASYGAGALAWGLGNISLAFHAFGHYRDVDADEDSGKNRTPPPACAALAGYTYRAIQLAVLLLAAGTITGAIWADFAWGRYWGWDPKEVWALVTLLVYMVILHGRWAGWTGDFGMAVGAVLGATSIMMAWYGVNFILTGGLHSYGIGSGGQTPVLILIACNWVFVACAALRYQIERRV